MYHPTEGRVTVYDPVSGKRFQTIDPQNPPPLVDVLKVGGIRPGPPGDPYSCYGPTGQGRPKYPYNDHWLLVPGQFYLGETLETTYCRGVVPHLDGRSTCGRLSIEAHKTAGVGDNGFNGRWTLEIEATEPVLVRPGDRLFQIYFTPAWGKGMAHVIRSIAKNEIIRFLPTGPHHLGFDVGQIEEEVDPGRLIEVDDLYGQDEGSHYQDSGTVKGPSPLD